MVPGLEKVLELIVNHFNLGKHVCSSFPKQMEKRCNSSFFIFHLDIWGPSRVFFFGFKYCHFYWWIFSMHLVVLILFIMSLQDLISSLPEPSNVVLLFFFYIYSRLWNTDGYMKIKGVPKLLGIVTEMG